MSELLLDPRKLFALQCRVRYGYGIGWSEIDTSNTVVPSKSLPCSLDLFGLFPLSTQNRLRHPVTAAEGIIGMGEGENCCSDREERRAMRGAAPATAVFGYRSIVRSRE